MTVAKEIAGSWHSVILPPWLRAFDCRNEDSESAKTPWGVTLWGSERAAFDLGLLQEVDRFYTMPCSCSTYIDSRTASESELQRQVTSMVAEAKGMKKEYDRVRQMRFRRKDRGGSVIYLPAAIAMANFGWSVIADKRTSTLMYFQ